MVGPGGIAGGRATSASIVASAVSENLEIELSDVASMVIPNAERPKGTTMRPMNAKLADSIAEHVHEKVSWSSGSRSSKAGSNAVLAPLDCSLLHWVVDRGLVPCSASSPQSASLTFAYDVGRSEVRILLVVPLVLLTARLGVEASRLEDSVDPMDISMDAMLITSAKDFVHASA